MINIYEFNDWEKYLNIPHAIFTNLIRNFDWQRGIPGGWLEYSPPREVIAYGDGSKYTDEGHAYDKLYKETAWKGSTPASYTTAVCSTASLPKKFIHSGIMKAMRDLLRKNNVMVNDYTCTGMWCNYYNLPDDHISAHTDDEDYYEKNYDEHTVFVSLTVYEDECFVNDNLARFQIEKDKKWKDVYLPHLSLMVMSGNINHRVLKPKGLFFRPRYNITFRTPISPEEDIVKNFRFFSNFGRYYRPAKLLFVPEKIFIDIPLEKDILNYHYGNKTATDKKGNKYKLNLSDDYTSKAVKYYSKHNDIKLKLNIMMKRKEILDELNISSAPNTTTTEALYILSQQYNNLINDYIDY